MYLPRVSTERLCVYMSITLGISDPADSSSAASHNANPPEVQRCARAATRAAAVSTWQGQLVVAANICSWLVCATILCLSAASFCKTVGKGVVVVQQPNDHDLHHVSMEDDRGTKVVYEYVHPFWYIHIPERCGSGECFKVAGCRKYQHPSRCTASALSALIEFASFKHRLKRILIWF